MRGKVPRYLDTQFHQNDSDGVARFYPARRDCGGRASGIEGQRRRK
jgi:hypothetical protein